jgi:hypothetical protein
MKKVKLSLIAQILIFLLPLNIWSNGNIANIQWIFFQYQRSVTENTLLPKSMNALGMGLDQYTEILNTCATFFWILGGVLLVTGFCITLFAFLKNESSKIRTSSWFMVLGGIFLFISALCRFNGGFALPLGIPLILIVGWWMHQDELAENGDRDQLSILKDPVLMGKIAAVFLFFVLLLSAIAAKTDITSIMIAVFTLFAIILILFPFKIETNRSYVAWLSGIILLGTFLRLWMAYSYFGNFDMGSYTAVSDFVLKGINVYTGTPFYNYSPVWFNVLGILRIFSDTFSLPFHFAVRGFLTIIDLLTLLLLLEIGKLKELTNSGLIRLSLLFYLNPISYLLTGFHGQFENLALFFIILAIYLYLKFDDDNSRGKYLAWFVLTMGFVVKHNTLTAVLTGIINFFKKPRHIVLFFSLTVAIFLSTFIFYWATGSQAIISQVFMYGGLGERYGITSIIRIPELKYLLIAGLLIYPFFIKEREMLEQFLLGFLFFITFTTGIGIQYFVLPIAFGALRPSNGFLLYTFIATIVILGSGDNLHIFGFSFFPMNAIWICATVWLFFTHFQIKESDNIISPVQ